MDVRSLFTPQNSQRIHANTDALPFLLLSIHDDFLIECGQLSFIVCVFSMVSNAGDTK